jgi:hypothetical protein
MVWSCRNKYKPGTRGKMVLQYFVLCNTCDQWLALEADNIVMATREAKAQHWKLRTNHHIWYCPQCSQPPSPSLIDRAAPITQEDIDHVAGLQVRYGDGLDIPAELAALEQRYAMTSAEFMRRWKAGDVADTYDMNYWSALIRHNELDAG